jgi:orotate phosphoribosyltransferase
MTEQAQMDMNAIELSLHEATRATRGHFRYESGHHGDLWLELESLFTDARRLRHWASALAVRAATCRPEAVCGPLTGGAFVAQFIAAEIGADFVFAERHVESAGAVRYRIPSSLRATLRDRRVLLVDDAVNAGSALLSTLADATDCGATLAGFASLLSLGDAASRIAARGGAPFSALVSLERRMWRPEECPLCRADQPLMDPLS